MSTRSRLGLAAVALVVVLAAVLWWANRPAPIPSQPPASAPKVGSCWVVDYAAAQVAMPWPGSPVSCRVAHTAEVFHIGQVDHSLIDKSRSGTGEDKKISDNLMYAEARRTCATLASTYLGANWHQAQVTVLADWLKPASDGFFGCALAQTADPGGQKLVNVVTSFRGLLSGDGTSPLDISCVTRGVSAGGLAYIPCNQPHDGEFVGVYTVTPANAPFQAAGVEKVVTTGCAALVGSYLGLAKEANRPDVSAGYVGPTSASTWLGSDQSFACYAMAPVKIRGSIRNLGTRALPR